MTVITAGDPVTKVSVNSRSKLTSVPGSRKFALPLARVQITGLFAGELAWLQLTVAAVLAVSRL